MTEKNQEKTLQDLFHDMDQILEYMEGKETSLEEMFDMYHQGMKLLKQCDEKIGTIEKKMLALDERGDLYEFEQ